MVDCYGAFVLADPPEGSGMSVRSLRDRLPRLSAPVLGLFGADDGYPSPSEVRELDDILTGLDKAHSFHTFEGAGHAFFAVDRPSYRPVAAVAGWQLIRDFLAENLGSPEGWGR